MSYPARAEGLVNSTITNTCGARSAQIRLASSRSQSQLTDFSQISAHTSDAWRHSHPWSHSLSGIFIVTSLNDTSAPHAREHLRSCLHQTNPCAKQKVLSLTKPKAKIYKTKSLGHYITTIYIYMYIYIYKFRWILLTFSVYIFSCWSFHIAILIL